MHKHRSTLLVVAVVVMMLVISIVPAAAQTATPVPPTAAPVSLEVPTGVLFSSTNSWLETFAPIAAIGIGITIALAVLGYLGKMIVGAFKG